MTFNEFLIKKKIDSAQFSKTEPGLFSEFEIHYNQMGEKSFDHSKKFWFNKLRRRFHLAEVPKPAKEPIEINELAAQAEPLISPTVTASGVTGSSVAAATKDFPVTGQESSKPVYKPRFKVPTSIKNADEQSSPVLKPDEPKDIPSESSAPPAYKPRFKAPTKESTAVKPSPEPGISSVEETKPKPAYKPRFNSATLNAANKEESKEKEEVKQPVTKSAYVPRFKASNVAPKIEVPKKVDEESTTENQQTSTESNPKPAYKPRFKPGITKPKDTD